MNRLHFYNGSKLLPVPVSIVSGVVGFEFDHYAQSVQLPFNIRVARWGLTYCKVARCSSFFACQCSLLYILTVPFKFCKENWNGLILFRKSTLRMDLRKKNMLFLFFVPSSLSLNNIFCFMKNI